MDLTGECQIVRIYVGETERVEGRPLYEVIVEKAEKALKRNSRRRLN